MDGGGRARRRSARRPRGRVREVGSLGVAVMRLGPLLALCRVQIYCGSREGTAARGPRQECFIAGKPPSLWNVSSVGSL